MPVTVRWIDEQHTAIQMEFSGQWQWPELNEARDLAWEMLETANEPVNFVLYNAHEVWMPPNYLENLRGIVAEVHPNAGLMVIVSTNPLFRALFELFNKVAMRVGFSYRFVASLEDAYTLLDLSQAA